MGGPLSGGAAGVLHNKRARVHLSVPVFKKNTTIQREDTQRDTERANRGGKREEQERNFGRSGGGLSSGGYGVQGSGFRVHFRFFGTTKTATNQKKMKSEMSKDKKKQKKSARRKERKKETERTLVRIRPNNFDFGQFRLRPIQFRPAGRNRIVRSRIGRSRASSHFSPCRSQCQQFITRAQKWLVTDDEKRILLVKQLKDGQQRLHSLREQVSKSAEPVHPHQIGRSEPPTNREEFAIRAGRIGGADP